MTSPQLTPEQARQFAPDASAAKNAQKLAKPQQWQTLYWHEQVIWGEIQGSALYRAAFHFEGFAFKCSCPSFKQPCKHGLALVLTYAEHFQAFKTQAPDMWVAEWLSKRQASAAKKAEKIEQASANKVVDTEAQNKRIAAREKKVQAGVAELRVWLNDLLRAGLAQAKTLSYRHFEHMASRLVDAQANGLALLIGELSSALAQAQWQQTAPLVLARLELLLSAYERLASLPVPLQADVRHLIGWNTSQEEVLASPALSDEWLILGFRDGDLDNNGRYRRQWLWGQRSQRPALVLNFAFGFQSLAPAWPQGMTLPASVCWYPSATPQRVVVKEQRSAYKQTPVSSWGYADIASALQAQALLLAQNPLLNVVPWLLSHVVPVLVEGQYVLCDRQGWVVPVQVSDGWALLALSGSAEICVFGEWDGQQLLVLSAWQGEEWLGL